MLKGILFFLSLLIILIILRASFYEWLSKRNHKKEVTGTYLIDLNRTDLAEYTSNIDTYKNLSIRFNSDNTFRMNMQVPFIYDTIGRWTVSGSRLDEMNNLFFDELDYSGLTGGSPFTQVHYKEGDSIFYMHTPRPKEGMNYLMRVYFKKITR
jgi:hypothetical protein